MTKFRIEADNNITALATSQKTGESAAETETFSNVEELTALAEKWPAARLVEIWNSVPGVQPVQRFTSRQAATIRIWKNIKRLASGRGAEERRVTAKKPSAAKKATRSERKEHGGNSKSARVIALLRRPQGASLEVIMRTTGWQSHSVRGFLSGQLKKKLGLKVRSAKRDGKRVYSIKP